MGFTDEISEEVLNAMHIIAAANDGLKAGDGNTALHVDYEEGLLIYENFKSNRTVKANINGDSERGAIIDFAKRIILHE